MDVLYDRIEHFVVLMLENRSFDNLLGGLYPGKTDFDGLTGRESNPQTRFRFLSLGAKTIPVKNIPSTTPDVMSIPTPDPGESFADINMQLFGIHATASNGVPPMSGFIDNYMRQKPDGLSPSPQKIMHYFTPDQVPALSRLAKSFAVSDQWYASAPCQTWPNRFFMHCATAGGATHNGFLPPHRMSTIFRRFEDQGSSNGWNIYFHDMPQALALTELWPLRNHFHSYDRFQKHICLGTLPSYSFIEPRYFPDTNFPSDMHPPHDISFGDNLVADVYNTVRQSNYWTKTLLIITFDEHGGCYDHVPPPLAVPPDNVRSKEGFCFDRYGVRVPVVLISPYVSQGKILRVKKDSRVPHQGPPYPFDHTSIIATIRKRFGLGSPLTRRDEVAPDLEMVFDLKSPDNNGPSTIELTEHEIANEELARAKHKDLSLLQKGLHDLAAYLPDLTGIADTDVESNISAHVEAINSGEKSIAVPSHRTPAEALSYLTTCRQKMLGW